MWLLQFVSGALGSTAEDGQYLKKVTFDVDDRGDCAVEVTPDPNQAQRFESSRDVLDLWKTQSVVRPLRDDQKPNRPLTSWTIEVVKRAEAVAKFQRLQNTKVQYGCECASCLVHPDRPAASAPLSFEIERDGRRLKVCTRCHISSDKIVALLVDCHTPIAPFLAYDASGTLVMLDRFRLAEQPS